MEPLVDVLITTSVLFIFLLASSACETLSVEDTSYAYNRKQPITKSIKARNKLITSDNGARTAFPSEHLSSPPVFSGVRVTRSLVLYVHVCFVDRCLSFCTFSFGHCVVCSSIYELWLPLWYLQTLLRQCTSTRGVVLWITMVVKYFFRNQVHATLYVYYTVYIFT